MNQSLLFCWFQESVTLRNLWALGHTVIVSYDHDLASYHGDLWPPIPYWWANKCKAEALIEEFEHRKQHGRPGDLLGIQRMIYCFLINAAFGPQHS